MAADPKCQAIWQPTGVQCLKDAGHSGDHKYPTDKGDGTYFLHPDTTNRTPGGWLPEDEAFDTTDLDDPGPERPAHRIVRMSNSQVALLAAAMSLPREADDDQLFRWADRLDRWLREKQVGA